MQGRKKIEIIRQKSNFHLSENFRKIGIGNQSIVTAEFKLNRGFLTGCEKNLIAIVSLEQ